MIFCCSEADQKKNPSAVVTALKFYAKTVMAQEADKQKFMMTKSQLPFDDDNDDEQAVLDQMAPKVDFMGNGSLFRRMFLDQTYYVILLCRGSVTLKKDKFMVYRKAFVGNVISFLISPIFPLVLVPKVKQSCNISA